MTKTQLKKRWKDQEFLNSLSIPLDRIPTQEELQDIDLRGVPKLGNGEPLWNFSIHSSLVHDIDLSFGNGALGIYESNIHNMKCNEFRFIKQSSFLNSKFIDSSFEKSKFSFDLTDCEFENCNFDLTEFKGGMNEYGFQRCIFTNCSFKGIRWERTYFKAATFINCDFSQAQIIDCVTLSFKHKNCKSFSSDIFLKEDNPKIIEIG